jgi:hypothetical protein
MSTSNAITDRARTRCGPPSPATSTSRAMTATTKRAGRGTCSLTSGLLLSFSPTPREHFVGTRRPCCAAPGTGGGQETWHGKR